MRRAVDMYTELSVHEDVRGLHFVLHEEVSGAWPRRDGFGLLLGRIEYGPSPTVHVDGFEDFPGTPGLAGVIGMYRFVNGSREAHFHDAPPEWGTLQPPIRLLIRRLPDSVVCTFSLVGASGTVSKTVGCGTTPASRLMTAVHSRDRRVLIAASVGVALLLAGLAETGPRMVQIIKLSPGTASAAAPAAAEPERQESTVPVIVIPEETHSAETIPSPGQAIVIRDSRGMLE